MKIYRTEKNIVSAVFKDLSEARAAVDHLRRAGVPDTEMSLVTSGDIYPEKTYRVIDGAYVDDDPSAMEKATEAGATVGGVGGFLVGLGTIAVPGAGPLLVVGSVLMSVITGLSVGALAGGAVGIFLEIGFSREQAEELEKALGEGQALVLAHGGRHSQQQIREILEKFDPLTVRERTPTLS